VVKGLGLSALAVTAFVVSMTAGSGRAAEPTPVAKTSAKPEATRPDATKADAAKADAAKAVVAAPVKTSAPAAKDAGGKPAIPAGASGRDVKDPNAASAPGKATEGEAKETSKEASKDTSKTASVAGTTSPRRTKSKHKRDGSASDDEPQLPPGQGPPPPSPLSATDLHQEANRERGPGGDFNAPPRVKLEQLLSEVGKARQSLHDDTLKLEALAGNEPSRGGESATADAPAPAVPGGPQPPQKNPLDVLAKALRGIKPEQAGPIVARLDKGLAATVLLKMPPADAGKIMGALNPEVAAELATQIAMRAPSPPGGKR